MIRRAVQCVLMLACVTVFASCGGNSSDDGVPLIFAAASLSDVLTESAEVYERETGKRVEFSFGGSITLANQIVKLGAPADGVLFAGAPRSTIFRCLPTSARSSSRSLTLV